MTPLIRVEETGAHAPTFSPSPLAQQGHVFPLGGEFEQEAREFLARRPAHTVCMIGLIHDNGLESPSNRGTFYGCRDEAGRLAGVALFGHHTLLEARAGWVVEAFAEHARREPPRYMVMAERDVVRRFWRLVSGGQPPRHACRMELLEKPLTAPRSGTSEGLRPAAPSELELVVPVNARIITEEHGVNPLERDAEGFRSRLAGRISKERVLVDVRENRLLFKADVVVMQPEVAYVEGLYLAPELRGTEHGESYMRALEAYLWGRTKSICGFVSKENERATAFYQKAGYRSLANYETLFAG